MTVAMNAYRYPCKDCTKREPGCHGRCQSYQEIKELNNQVSQAQRREQAVRLSLYEIGREGARMQRNRNKKKYERRWEMS